MKTIKYTVPPTHDLGSHSGFASASWDSTVAQDALRDYNRSRERECLPPLTRMPAGTVYERPAAPYFIQRKAGGQIETVDEFTDRKEARAMRDEYAMSDKTATFYISRRACRDWKEARS